MKIAGEKIIRLMVGYFLYGVGIVMSVNAGLGLSPWGVFSQGMSVQLGMTLGTAVMASGAVILIFDILLGERIGWGTVGNVYFIGTFIDLIDASGFIPVFDSIFLRLLQVILSLAVVSMATYLYLSAQMGSGPRDGLMVALTKRTGKPVGLIRTIIETAALIAGYLMGGIVGWGTLIMSLGIGPCIQFTFKVFKFDVRQVTHRTIDQDIALLLKNKEQ